MRIGLYGGTFSPPHLGHVRAAKLFLEKAELDKLIVMPSGVPPHKEADSSASKEDRLEMSRLAFGDFASVSAWEMQREKKSYTVETLRYLKKEYPEDELFMLVGKDMLLSLERWYEPAEIMSLCEIYALCRDSKGPEELERTAEELRKKYCAKICVLTDEPLVVSSTEIRERTLSGESIEDLVPESVCRYIKTNGLYKNE